MLFLAKKRLNNKTLENIKIPDGYSKTYSFNRQTTLKNGQTKYLIVGTITPKEGRDNGYFYCSNKNNQYHLIDLAFSDGKSLEEAKKESKINEIKSILIQRKIAFLDVIDEAITNDKDPSDNAILNYVLDYNAFKDIDFSSIKVIANSKNAKKALEHIIGQKTNIILLPQNIMGYSKKYKNQKELENEWKKVFEQ